MIPARYSPRPLRALLRAALGHVRDSANSAFWPACLLTAAFVAAVVTADVYTTWDGIHTLGGAR